MINKDYPRQLELHLKAKKLMGYLDVNVAFDNIMHFINYYFAKYFLLAALYSSSAIFLFFIIDSILFPDSLNCIVGNKTILSVALGLDNYSLIQLALVYGLGSVVIYLGFTACFAEILIVALKIYLAVIYYLLINSAKLFSNVCYFVDFVKSYKFNSQPVSRYLR